MQFSGKKNISPALDIYQHPLGFDQLPGSRLCARFENGNHVINNLIILN